MKSFSQYCEYVQAKASYTDSLERELGIKRQHTAGMNPGWAALTTLGDRTVNGMTYQIVRWEQDSSGNYTGAIVKAMHTDRAYQKDKDGNMIRSPDDHSEEGKEFFMSKAQIDKMMNQEAPPPQPPEQPGQAPDAGAGQQPAAGQTMGQVM